MSSIIKYKTTFTIYTYLESLKTRVLTLFMLWYASPITDGSLDSPAPSRSRLAMDHNDIWPSDSNNAVLKYPDELVSATSFVMV